MAVNDGAVNDDADLHMWKVANGLIVMSVIFAVRVRVWRARTKLRKTHNARKSLNSRNVKGRIAVH